MRLLATAVLMFAVLTPTITMARTHRSKGGATYHLKKVHRRNHSPGRFTVMDEEAANQPR